MAIMYPNWMILEWPIMWIVPLSLKYDKRGTPEYMLSKDVQTVANDFYGFALVVLFIIDPDLHIKYLNEMDYSRMTI